MATVVDTERNDFAVTYAALLLHDAGLGLTADKLTTVMAAAGIEVPAFYTKLYCRVLANRNLDDLLMTTCAVAPSAAGPAAAAAGSAAAPAAQAEKKEEKKEEDEEDDALGGDGEGMGLFGGDEDDY